MNLRAIEPEDLDLLYSIENDPDLWESSNSDAPYSRFALKQYIASGASLYSCGELRLIIEINTENGKKAIGTIDLTSFSPQSARAEIGIAILKEFRGKGHGSRAIQLLEQLASTRFRIHSLYAFVSPKNLASYNLFLNNNYQIKAELEDWHFNNGKYENAIFFLKIL